MQIFFSKTYFIQNFVHPIFHFWFLITFGDKVMKIQTHYVIFVYILQGKMGKTEKKTRKKIMQPIYQKQNNENLG